MKTIVLSDEDYALLMSLSEEIKTQPHHVQAAPRYWEPSSEKLETNVNDEGEVIQIFDPDECENYTPEEYAEKNEYGLFEDFLNIEYGTQNEYDKSMETDWIEYLRSNADTLRIYSSDWTRKIDHNPSLFLSDVQGFIKSNKHHLGRDPKPYANTIWRMPKMEALVELLGRLTTVKRDEA